MRWTDRPRPRGRRPETERRTAASAAVAAPPQVVLALQRSAGNRAVTSWLARDPLTLGASPASGTTAAGREQVVATLDAAALATVIRQFREKPNAEGAYGIDLPDGTYVIPAGEAQTLKPAADRRKEQLFGDFATGRTPLFAAMTGAADAAARHAAIDKLSAYDAQHLPGLTQIYEAMGKVWSIEPAARDAVLAAIQLEAATEAIGELGGDTAKIRARVKKAAGMESSDEWCGFFSSDHYVKARMDDDLRTGFFSTDDVYAFFHYTPRKDLPKRVKKWVWDGAAWKTVDEYHDARGSRRTWLDHEAVKAGGALDIRPGDTVLLDTNADGKKIEHIVMAASYDPATSTLITIGGNDDGYTLLPAGAAKPPADATRATAEKATGLELRKPGGDFHVGVGVESTTPAAGKTRSRVYGVGRPSLVDFEEHIYAAEPLDKAPPPLKSK